MLNPQILAIKRTKWDEAFSGYIRYRDNWTCQRCNKKYIEKSQGLHCSHFVGRGNWRTRLEPSNAMALCHGCHIYVTANPLDHVKLWEKKFNKKEQKRILNLKNDMSIKKRDIATKEVLDKLNKMLKNAK